MEVLVAAAQVARERHAEAERERGAEERGARQEAVRAERERLEREAALEREKQVAAPPPGSSDGAIGGSFEEFQRERRQRTQALAAGAVFVPRRQLMRPPRSIQQVCGCTMAMHTELSVHIIITIKSFYRLLTRREKSCALETTGLLRLKSGSLI